MRRSTLFVLVLLIAFPLAACGGGDDAENTPTPAAAKATATKAGAATTATAAPEATGGTGSGPGTGPGSGASGTPDLPASSPTTGSQPPATPTRRPATVVSTPRPIATRPPQPTAPPEADDTPTPLQPTPEDGQLTPVLEDDFEDPENSWFETGSTEFGTTMTIENGVYVITPAADGGWQTIPVSVDESWSFADGQIVADASIQGDGEFGLVARQTQDADGAYYFYLCWLNPAGTAGCSLYSGGTFTTLFSQDDPSLFQDVNTLLLQMIGTELIYEVNGVQIGAIDDSTVASGYWGFYAEAVTGAASALVDYVAIAVP